MALMDEATIVVDKVRRERPGASPVVRPDLRETSTETARLGRRGSLGPGAGQPGAAGISAAVAEATLDAKLAMAEDGCCAVCRAGSTAGGMGLPEEDGKGPRNGQWGPGRGPARWLSEPMPPRRAERCSGASRRGRNLVRPRYLASERHRRVRGPAPPSS